MVRRFSIKINLSKLVGPAWGDLASQRFNRPMVQGVIKQAKDITLEVLLAVHEDLLLERQDRQVLSMAACCAKLAHPFTLCHFIHQVMKTKQWLSA